MDRANFFPVLLESQTFHTGTAYVLIKLSICVWYVFWNVRGLFESQENPWMAPYMRPRPLPSTLILVVLESQLKLCRCGWKRCLINESKLRLIYSYEYSTSQLINVFTTFRYSEYTALFSTVVRVNRPKQTHERQDSDHKVWSANRYHLLERRITSVCKRNS